MANDKLANWADEALDEIEYVIGDTNTKWGAQRTRDGHPRPFKLNYTEIGNEDGFDNAKSYDGRFTQFYDAIKAKYPQLKLVSTVGGERPLGKRQQVTRLPPPGVGESVFCSGPTRQGRTAPADGSSLTELRFHSLSQ